MQLEGEWDFDHNWKNKGQEQKKFWHLDERSVIKVRLVDSDETEGKWPGLKEISNTSYGNFED